MKLEDLPERYRHQAERQLATSLRSGASGPLAADGGGRFAADAAVPRRPAIPASDLERAPGRPPMAPPKNTIVDTPCRIRLLCHRHRLADPDGISAKALIDGLVLAGILAGDSTREIVESPVITQVKVNRSMPEQTIVEIYHA